MMGGRAGVFASAKNASKLYRLSFNNGDNPERAPDARRVACGVLVYARHGSGKGSDNEPPGSGLTNGPDVPPDNGFW